MGYFVAFLFINQLVLLRVDGTVASPAGILNGVWLIATSLFQTGIIPFSPASTKLVWVLSSTFGCFYLGYYVIRGLLKSPKIVEVKTLKEGEKTGIDLVLIFLLAVLSLRTFSVFFGLYFRFGGVAGIFENGDAIYSATRFGEWSPGVPVLIPIEPLSSFFVAYNYIHTRRFQLVSILILLEILLLTTLLQSRYMLMLSIFAFAAPVACYVRETRLLTVGRLLVFVGVIAGITASRGLSSGVSSDSGVGALPIAAELGSIVYYLSCGIGGLNAYLEMGIDEYSGIYSLNGLAQMLEMVFQIDGIAMKYEEITYYTPLTTITATALKFLMDDFGLYYIPVTTFVGIFTGYLWSSAGSMKSLNIWATSVLSIVFGYSFFGWIFFINGFWLYMVVSLLLMLFIKSNVVFMLRKAANEMLA